MELKWTGKALSDMARLHEFLAAVNKPAAGRAVQALTKTPPILLGNPRLGERLFQFAPREVRRVLLGGTRFPTESGFDPLRAEAVAYPGGSLNSLLIFTGWK